MANETKWTPGPYMVKRSESHGPRIVAPRDGYRVELGGGEYVAVCVQDDIADLFAAAPDLYEALDAVMNFKCTSWEEVEGLWAKARAALAKARGENPDAS